MCNVFKCCLEGECPCWKGTAAGRRRALAKRGGNQVAPAAGGAVGAVAQPRLCPECNLPAPYCSGCVASIPPSNTTSSAAAPVAVVTTAVVAAPGGTAAELKALAQLKADGILSEEEFIMAKTNVLGDHILPVVRSGDAPTPPAYVPASEVTY